MDGSRVVGQYIADAPKIDYLPRATDNMDEIIRFIQELIERGFAYASGGDVFFDVARDPQYGQLSNRTADAQQGEGGEAASRKRSPADFALWKSAKEGEPSWESHGDAVGQVGISNVLR